MSDRAMIGLDNPMLAGRLRTPPVQPRPTRSPARQVQRQPVESITRPATLRPSISAPLNRPPITTDARARLKSAAAAPLPINPVQTLLPAPSYVPSPEQSHWTAPSLSISKPKIWQRYSKLQMALVSMACFMFLVGIFVSLQTVLTNHKNSAQVAALAKSANSRNNSGSVPSTDKPSAKAISQYIVAPDAPRYLKIPKLGVNARVLQVGTNKDGSLGTPSNVFDTAWYNASAKPGQPGATLIDGHVSSWTSHGVFYGLKNLKPGDTMQVVRGDGSVFNYKVVKTQVYKDNNVDMRAAITPVVQGTPGLNLITCTGQVKPGTSEFNERVIVFTEQV
jgi:LPXTG-site transpeptidase (sortase) family protein